MRTVGLRFLLAAALSGGLGRVARSSAEEVWAPAARLYMEGKYAEAYRTAEALLAQHPDDPVLIRLMGMALLDDGRPGEAVRVLEEGVRRHPTSVAMAYYLAQAYAFSGRLEESVALVEEILRVAPENEYGTRARAVLDELYALQKQRGAPKAGSDWWDLSWRIGVEVDDNVPARAKNDPAGKAETATRMSTAAHLSVKLIEQESGRTPITFGLTAVGYRSWHEDREYRAYDVLRFGGGAFASWSGAVAGRMNFSRLAVNHGETELDGDFYGRDTELALTHYAQMTSRIAVGLNADYSWKNLIDPPEFPAYFSRDGEEWGASTSLIAHVVQNRVSIDLNYGYRNYDLDGTQFRGHSHNGSGSVRWLLPFQFELAGAVRYQETTYVKFQPDPRRLDNVWTYHGSLRRSFSNDRYALELSTGHTRADSNRDFAEYEQTVYGLAFSLNL